MNELPAEFTVRGHTYRIHLLDEREVDTDPTLVIYRDQEEVPIITAHLDPASPCKERDRSHFVVEAPVDERFASLGDPVAAEDVPDLVRAGREVWSYGYGDDDDFTTIEASDLWAWEGDGSIYRADPAVVKAWGPFRVSKEVNQ